MNKEVEKIVLDKENDDYCDLDHNKICDNCEKCLELDKNYKIIKITKIIESEEEY